MSMNAIFSELKRSHLSQMNEEKLNETNVEDQGTGKSTEGKKKLPEPQHIYWDKKHKNAYYVVGVYPKDNKVSYWNIDGTRLEGKIDVFMEKYEPSTNEDDYDLFEERTDK